MIRKLPHYIVLFGIFAAAISGFILFSWDRQFQKSLIIATACAYVSWGVVHHWIHDDLNFEIVLEYIAIALLGSLVTIFLLA